MPSIVPEHVTVRMYQVGFGDCFLLSLRYAQPPVPGGRKERHVLIDFGSTHSPTRAKLNMEALANQITADCDGKLDVVIVTHRHRDHLSGFGNQAAADVLAKLHPDLVVRPWTEEPDIPANATGLVGTRSRGLLKSLGDAEGFAHALAGAIDSSASTSSLRGRVRRMAEDQLKNAEAIERLRKWSAATDGEYLHAGVASKIESIVPGLGVEVLGPPTVDQFPGVVNARARDPEYWMLYQGVVTTGLPLGTLDLGDPDDDDPVGETAGDQAAAAEALAEGVSDLEQLIPAGPARWLADRLRSQQMHSLQRIVRSLDDALNNTSLILLLKVGDRRLLFPGDGQIENWQFTLDRLKRSPALKRRLGAIDLYKVGHHGSRNATPRSLLDLWGQATRPVSLLSTRAGIHGHTESTAVPRATLVAALLERTDLLSTESIKLGEAIVVEADTHGLGAFTRVP